MVSTRFGSPFREAELRTFPPQHFQGDRSQQSEGNQGRRLQRQRGRETMARGRRLNGEWEGEKEVGEGDEGGMDRRHFLGGQKPIA